MSASYNCSSSNKKVLKELLIEVKAYSFFENFVGKSCCEIKGILFPCTTASMPPPSVFRCISQDMMQPQAMHYHIIILCVLETMHVRVKINKGDYIICVSPHILRLIGAVLIIVSLNMF